ncbi:unnamed protein product, partial [Didymodactylos carnosus]
ESNGRMGDQVKKYLFEPSNVVLSLVHHRKNYQYLWWNTDETIFLKPSVGDKGLEKEGRELRSDQPVPADEILSCDRTIRNEINKMAEQERKALKHPLIEVTEIEGLYLSPDIWTDNYRKVSYLGATAHYIIEQQLQIYGLDKGSPEIDCYYIDEEENHDDSDSTEESCEDEEYDDGQLFLIDYTTTTLNNLPQSAKHILQTIEDSTSTQIDDGHQACRMVITTNAKYDIQEECIEESPSKLPKVFLKSLMENNRITKKKYVKAAKEIQSEQLQSLKLCGKYCHVEEFANLKLLILYKMVEDQIMSFLTQKYQQLESISIDLDRVRYGDGDFISNLLTLLIQNKPQLKTLKLDASYDHHRSVSNLIALTTTAAISKLQHFTFNFYLLNTNSVHNLLIQLPYLKYLNVYVGDNKNNTLTLTQSAVIPLNLSTLIMRLNSIEFQELEYLFLNI